MLPQQLQTARIPQRTRPHQCWRQRKRRGHGIKLLAHKTLIKMQKIRLRRFRQARNAPDGAHGHQRQKHGTRSGTFHAHHPRCAVDGADRQIQRFAKAQPRIAYQQKNKMQTRPGNLTTGARCL